MISQPCGSRNACFYWLLPTDAMQTGMVEDEICFFPQTRGFLQGRVWNGTNYSMRSMTCTMVEGQLLCARPAKYVSTMVVESTNQSTSIQDGNRRASKQNKTVTEAEADLSQQIYLGDDPEVIQDNGAGPGVVLLSCPLGACQKNNTCKNLRTGPVSLFVWLSRSLILPALLSLPLLLKTHAFSSFAGIVNHRRQ
jgi:hypothetical protein